MPLRDKYIDILKGIGIILVIWGHCSSFLFNEIYAFHMPLFFFLSGCFSSCKLPFGEFVRKKFRQLIIPFVIFFLLSCIYYWILLWITGRFSISDIYALTNIFPYNNKLPNAPLWFFWALFWMSLMYYILQKYVKNNVTIFIICILMHILEFYLNNNGINLPAYMGRSCREIIYMHLGYILYNKSSFYLKLHNNGNIKNLLYGTLTLICFAALFLIQDKIINGGGIYYCLFSILTAVCGIFLCSFIGLFIEQSRIKAIFTYLGTHTLCLFAIHLPLLEISRPIAKRLFITGSAPYDLTSFTIVFLLSVILGEMLMLILPKYLGKSRFLK